MKKLVLVLLSVMLFSCASHSPTQSSGSTEISPEDQKPEINILLDNWHEAAGNADFEAYFLKMTEDAVFIGTDPTENWKKPEFKQWAKPYFDRGQAWNFSVLERNLFISETGNTAWFDELLDTQMGICRGSGVVVEENGNWKIQHYVLSIAIPNENVSEVTDLKKDFDHNFISRLKNR